MNGVYGIDTLVVNVIVALYKHSMFVYMCVYVWVLILSFKRHHRLWLEQYIWYFTEYVVYVYALSRVHTFTMAGGYLVVCVLYSTIRNRAICHFQATDTKFSYGNIHGYMRTIHTQFTFTVHVFIYNRHRILFVSVLV